MTLPEEERTTAIGLARYAYEYLEAAIAVDDTIGKKPGTMNDSRWQAVARQRRSSMPFCG